MHTTGKRLLAVILAALMLFTAVPMGALAAITQNTPEYNKEILNALTGLVGSETEAQDYYEVLQNYGLLDEDGNAVESWSIMMDGEEITADELREILSGDYDPDKHIYVDGTFVTLSDVKTMLEIEDYIAYIRDTYYSDGEWTQEQIDSYQSLMTQVQSRGITLLGANPSLVGASGVNHGARVSVTQDATSGNTVTFNVSLSGASSGQVVSFDWKALSGSRPVTGTTSGTVTLTANSSGTASANFNVSYERIGCDIQFEDPNPDPDATDPIYTENPNPVRTAEKTVFYVNCLNLKNALFSANEKETIGIACQTEGTVESGCFPTVNDINTSICSFRDVTLSSGNVYSGYNGTYTYKEFPGLVSALRWGMINHVKYVNPVTISDYPIFYDYSDDDYYMYDLYYMQYTFKEMNTLCDDLCQRDAQGALVEWPEWHYGYDRAYWWDDHTHLMTDPGAPTNVIDEFTEKEYDLTDYPTTKALNQDLVLKDTFEWTGGLNTKNYISFAPIFNTYGQYNSKPIMYNVSDTKGPTVKTWSFPSGTFSTGEIVPIVVTFSEPVQAGASITVNGKKVTAAETGASNVMTFPYEVKEADDTKMMITNVTAADIVGHTLNVSPSADANGMQASGVELKSPVKSHTFDSFNATYNKTKDSQTQQKIETIHVELHAVDDAARTQWMGSDFKKVNNVSTSQTVFVSIDNCGEKTAPLTCSAASYKNATLTADIPLDPNKSDSAKDYVVELFIKENNVNNVIVGKAASVSQPGATFITSGDVSDIGLSVKKKDGVTDYAYTDDAHTIYRQDLPKLTLSYKLAAKDFDFPELVWSSSNTNVAKINDDGKTVSLVGEGTCKFILTATNGGVNGKQVTWETAPITVEDGYTPFLGFSIDHIQSVSGRDVNVYWTSNLCSKNGETPTTFHVSVKRGGTEVFTQDVTGTKSRPASSVTLPASVMEFQYGATAVNMFTVNVTAVFKGETFEANATVELESLPAKIKLNKLDSYYILDTAGSVEIGWDITNFNRFSSANASDLFRLLITKGNQTVYESSDPGAGGSDGHFTGSYTLGNLAFNANGSDKSSYRQVYTITIQAKNGRDSTWSYDSYLLYVYDADTLKLWVDGQAAGSLTMTNIPRILEMSQEQILALKRDISLHNVISANYGEYAWTEVDDQLSWASSNNDVATVNYQQGTLYEDIRNFTYTSYRPATEFVISGLSDGQTTVSAEHVLTGMTDSVNVTVRTLKDKLYLFQCYPQVKTALTYKDSAGTEKTVYSDNTGAAAIYEPNSIRSDVYCRSTGKDGNIYLGTFYQDQLASGERDSTQLELYPCNNLQLRRAAYAYLYLKGRYGMPYTGKITFRGGVYVDGVYKPGAKFELNSSGSVNLSGSQDQTVTLGSDGKLEIVMDQTQWGLPNNEITAGDNVHYTFLIKQADGFLTYYPIFADIDATVSQNAFVENGEAVVNFRLNGSPSEHAFVVGQYATAKNPATGYESTEDVLDSTGRVGPNDSLPEVELKTVAMWWGDDASVASNAKVKLFTESGHAIAPETATLSNNAYPFADEILTTYTVTLNKDTLEGTIPARVISGIYLEYYRDGANLSRKETLPLRVCNLTGIGKVEDSDTLTGRLQEMGMAMGTDAKTDQSTGDKFVNKALELVAGGNFSEGRGSRFKMKIAPTSDSTKFLGFVEVNVGNLENNVTGVYANDNKNSTSFGYKPGFKEIKFLLNSRKGYDVAAKNWVAAYKDEFNTAKSGNKLRNISYELQGYMETLIYYDFNDGDWKMTVLDGGFDIGGGVSYSWQWNYMVGPVPFNVELKVGGTAEVDMDAITAAYKKTRDADVADLDTEFLTELRIYLYLKLFAGVGFDYSVIALKIGIFGQINLDLQHRWLTRPYLNENGYAYLLSTGERNDDYPFPTLWGESFKINGSIGLEIIVKFLFINYEKALFSYNFDLVNTSDDEWKKINRLWAANQKNLQKTITALLDDGSASTTSVGGRQMVALNMAPTVESRDYLADGDREWNEPAAKRGFLGLFKAPARKVTGVADLQTNAYPYSDPELSADGSLMVYLSDMGDTDVTKTRAAFAVKSGNGYAQGGAIDDNGLGDSQLAVDGNQNFAVSAWTRQTVDIRKDAGSVLTNEDQMMMLGGTEVYASVYTGGRWTTTRLTNNSGADVAPTVAVRTTEDGNKAIVAWRSVVAGDAENITDFNQKDAILYKTYDGSAWSETKSLYNGTSGNVKGITSAMMKNGAAAIAYTLDTDSSDDTVTDREIVYAVVDASGEVTRNVRATTDEKLDENPQVAAVHFPNDDAVQERFVLGWYTQDDSTGVTVSDICLFDLDDEGVTGQLVPQSLLEAAGGADANVSSNFRFTKNAAEIGELSIVWVERDEGTMEELSDGTGAGTESQTADAGDAETDKDVLRGVKFYTYGQNDELIGFTGALNVADMPDATLIDHFDACSDGGNGVSAVVLGTTYGKDGATETKTGESVVGTTVTYTVPKAVSAIYTAADSYEDKIDVGGIMTDYETIRLGSTTQIRFSVRNSGINPISKIKIKIGDTQTTYSDLNLLPGNTLQVWADYEVPEDGVVDPEYTVTATFSSGSKTATGTVYLDYTDLQITGAEIMEEVDGQRVIQVKLNNGSDAALANSGRSVRLSFFSDPTYETPISSLPAVTVSDEASLQMIDGGGYSKQVTFDAAAYVKGDSEETVEIPESGVPVYIKAEVLKDNEIEPEFESNNNFGSVTCDNLKARTGQDVTLTSDFAIDGEGDNATTTVTVNMQNTRLGETASGNLIVTLLDENGEVLEQKQSYSKTAPNNGLLILGGEAKATENFTFSVAGADAQVLYSDVVLDYDNVTLANAAFSNIPGVTADSFTEQADGTFTATATADDVTTATVTAVAGSVYSTVSVKAGDGETVEGSNTVSQVVPLTLARNNTITITVTSYNGDSRDYVLTVMNRKSINVYADPKEKTYGDPDPVYTWNAPELVGDDTLDVTFTRDEGENIGEYAIHGEVAPVENYIPTFVEADLTINKRPIYIAAEPKEKIYGDPDPELTWTQEGLVEGDALNVTLTREEGRDVGVYAIDGDVAISDNYTPIFVLSTLTVNKRKLFITADPQTKVYGEDDPELTCQAQNIAYDDEIPVTLTREPGESVGTYRITTDVDACKNYVVSFTGADLTITKKTLSVTADAKAKTYGEEDPELTYTVTGLVDDDTLTGELTREPGEAKGTYAIRQGTVAANDNYVIDYTGADLTIAEKTLNITAHAKSKTYGETDPELTYTVEGLEDGDTLTGSLTRDEGEAAGTYAITLGSLSAGDDYAINFTGAQLTIETKALTVKADAVKKVYGDADPELTYTVEGLAKGDEISVTLTRAKGENAGSYAISAQIDGADNYAVTYIPADFTITKRPLIVTADAKSKREGKSDPKLTYTVDGLVEGDEITVTLSREPGEDVGRYAINAEIDAGDNYDVTYVGATFRIESKYCPLCGELHDKNVFDRILGCIHRFIYWIRNFFKVFSNN